MRRLRRDEAHAAAAHLDVEPLFLGFQDGTLVAEGALVASLKQVIDEVRPDLIATHALNDYHGDHRALSEAAGIAASFHAPVLRAAALHGVGFHPTHYVDITAHIDLKAAALRKHRSQDPERFVARAEELARFRSSQANGLPGTFAECFRFEPVYPFVDIRDLLPPASPIRPVRDRSAAAD